MKTRNYISDRIEICRNCLGVGMVEEEKGGLAGLLRPGFNEVECPVCGGSGRVKKTADITITIEPYHPVKP